MSVRGELRVVDHVPQAFAAFVAEEAPASMALSGGTAARQCYELLAVADVDWSEVEIFFGDERWVPVDDPDSNEGMARHAFVDQVLPAAVYSMRRAGETIEEAADAYDKLLREHPPVEFVHLGLGPDGHTASLFPGSPALEERERLVVATGDDLHPHPRLTWTFPALNRSPLAVFTVAGEEKRDALKRVKAGEELPAALVAAARIIWFVDEAANG
ncbi:MAG TPA: 6-phosphogluconolactonase [Acidimicrobiia bacterium]|nr:6-phosphogluconolactonase [Acidimicrobiia bacterium]